MKQWEKNKSKSNCFWHWTWYSTVEWFLGEGKQTELFLHCHSSLPGESCQAVAQRGRTHVAPRSFPETIIQSWGSGKPKEVKFPWHANKKGKIQRETFGGLWLIVYLESSIEYWQVNVCEKSTPGCRKNHSKDWREQYPELNIWEEITCVPISQKEKPCHSFTD